MTTTSTLRDGIFFASLADDLVAPIIAALVQTANEYLRANVTNCVVDLSEICYINSMGIGASVLLLTEFRTRGGEMVLINSADHPRKLRSLTKLNNIFAVAPTEIAAR